MAQDSPTRTMTLTRTFDAPVEQVWKQWSESENVMRWWGPKGFTKSISSRCSVRTKGNRLSVQSSSFSLRAPEQQPKG